MKALVYDLEIINMVPSKYEDRIDGLTYCNGWTDHKGMGISVIGCYDYHTDSYRVFLRDNFQEFLQLRDERDLVVSFNGIGFDDKVINACLGEFIQSIKPREHYDIMKEIKNALNLYHDFPVKGISLAKVGAANGGLSKTGDGALAPAQWQRGNYGAVVDYCLQDVRVTKKLFDVVLQDGSLIDPRNGSRLRMKTPMQETISTCLPVNSITGV